MIRKTLTVAALAAASLAGVTPVADAKPAHRGDLVTVTPIADKTINHNGKRERVVVKRITTRHANGFVDTDYEVIRKATQGKLPAKMPRCQYEDASGPRDLRWGCTYRGTTVNLDYALPLKTWGPKADPEAALILYVWNDGATEVGGW